MNKNSGSTGKHTVVAYFKNPGTEKKKVWVFDSRTEANEFFDDLRRIDKNGELFDKIVGVWYTWPNGSVIFDNDTEQNLC